MSERENIKKQRDVIFTMSQFSSVLAGVPPKTFLIGCDTKKTEQGQANLNAFEDLSRAIDQFGYSNLINKLMIIYGLKNGDVYWASNYKVTNYIVENGYFPVNFSMDFSLFKAYANGNFSDPLLVNT